MNKEKQIEEMASIIHDVAEAHHIIWCTELAKILYNAGYRKQSEGEWVYDEDCECFVCSLCLNSALNNYRGLSTNSKFCPNCGSRMKGV